MLGVAKQGAQKSDCVFFNFTFVFCARLCALRACPCQERQKEFHIVRTEHLHSAGFAHERILKKLGAESVKNYVHCGHWVVHHAGEDGGNLFVPRLKELPHHLPAGVEEKGEEQVDETGPHVRLVPA